MARHLPAHVIGEALVASERARPPASTEASSRVEPERRRPRKPILQVRINGARRDEGEELIWAEAQADELADAERRLRSE